MAGVQEMHLLNLTVAPAWQHRGLARGLLDALVVDCRADGALWLWLEVRESNLRAREVYRRYGFAQVGWRRGYYPAAAGRREDACVMRLPLDRGPPMRWSERQREMLQAMGVRLFGPIAAPRRLPPPETVAPAPCRAPPRPVAPRRWPPCPPRLPSARLMQP